MRFLDLLAVHAVAFLIGNAGRSVVCGAAFALALGAGAAAVADDDTNDRATIYQWTDSSGTHRYTPDRGRIPGSARDTVVTIQATDEDPGNTPIYFEPDPRASQVAVPEPDAAPEDRAAARSPATPNAAAAVIPPAPTDGSAGVTSPATPAGHPAVTSPVTSAPGAQSDRISELEAEIARYEAALKAHISRPSTDGDTEIPPELREMAARLPGLQAELATLQRRQDGAAAP